MIQDRRSMKRELTEEGIIRIRSVHSILSDDLDSKVQSGKLLTIKQRQYCLEIAQDFLETVNNDHNFSHRVMPGDETLLHVYDPETVSVTTMEAFINQEAQNSWTGPQRGQLDADSFP
ncbi:unnamed protein product [Dicrocoelium dendriticum]|nr:unnamed protein product [Dicrocoelium dendriticum]